MFLRLFWFMPIYRYQRVDKSYTCQAVMTITICGRPAVLRPMRYLHTRATQKYEVCDAAFSLIRSSVRPPTTTSSPVLVAASLHVYLHGATSNLPAPHCSSCQKKKKGPKLTMPNMQKQKQTNYSFSKYVRIPSLICRPVTPGPPSRAASHFLHANKNEQTLVRLRRLLIQALGSPIILL